VKIEKTEKRMRCVRGPSYRVVYGYDVCTDEGGVWDFTRTEWRWRGLLVWSFDGPKVKVPWHVFIADCLGTG
jgi:hypothetical protein